MWEVLPLVSYLHGLRKMPAEAFQFSTYSNGLSILAKAVKDMERENSIFIVEMEEAVSRNENVPFCKNVSFLMTME